MATLCETFRSIAFNTHERLMAAKSIDYQPSEETFTDNIMLDLKLKHPVEIFTRPFNKREEGVNGADWEWWLTNATEDSWLGLRIQAKILNLKQNEYSHLHHKVGKAKKTYQLANLKRESGHGASVLLLQLRRHNKCGVLVIRACSRGFRLFLGIDRSRGVSSGRWREERLRRRDGKGFALALPCLLLWIWFGRLADSGVELSARGP